MVRNSFFERGTSLLYALTASAIIATLTATGLFLVPLLPNSANMHLSLSTHTASPKETFTLQILVTTPIPVNTFAGLLTFNPAVIEVQKIDYNTSIADLWVEEPWFNQGNGTITFAGGSTRRGGFLGTGELVTVTFLAHAPGDTELQLHDIKILQHDGLGIAAPLTTPLETVFIITPGDNKSLVTSTSPVKLSVLRDKSRTDVNTDGKTSLADISIFLLYLAAQDTRADINQDGSVSAADFSIILNTIKSN